MCSPVRWGYNKWPANELVETAAQLFYQRTYGPCGSIVVRPLRRRWQFLLSSRWGSKILWLACLSVSLSVRIHLELHQICSACLRVVVVRYFSGDVAILLVLWMSCFFSTMGPMAEWRYRSSFAGVPFTGYDPVWKKFRNLSVCEVTSNSI